MKVGVIADTHGLLRPEAEARLAGVDHILHAGDVGAPGILPRLAAIASLTAIRGNVDTAAWAEPQGNAWSDADAAIIDGRYDVHPYSIVVFKAVAR